MGIGCSKSGVQFEDYLEQIREDKNFGDRTYLSTRQKIAGHLGACYDSKEFNRTFSEDQDKLKDYILPILKTGGAVMIGIWPSCKGHMVRVQSVTKEGLIVDDPYGKVTDFTLRQNCKSGGYETNSKTNESSLGKDNLWKWKDIKDVTILYVEVYLSCN